MAHHELRNVVADDYYSGDDDNDNKGKSGASNFQHYMVIGSFVPLIIQVIILCVLFFVFTYYYTKSHTCMNNREIWCKDDWDYTKQTESTDKTYNKCYQQKDHLASCLFGPSSAAAVKCIDYSKKGVTCSCVMPAGTDTAVTLPR